MSTFGPYILYIHPYVCHKPPRGTTLWVKHTDTITSHCYRFLPVTPPPYPTGDFTSWIPTPAYPSPSPNQTQSATTMTWTAWPMWPETLVCPCLGVAGPWLDLVKFTPEMDHSIHPNAPPFPPKQQQQQHFQSKHPSLYLSIYSSPKDVQCTSPFKIYILNSIKKPLRIELN